MDQSYSVFQLIEAYKAYMYLFFLLRAHVGSSLEDEQIARPLK